MFESARMSAYQNAVGILTKTLTIQKPLADKEKRDNLIALFNIFILFGSDVTLAQFVRVRQSPTSDSVGELLRLMRIDIQQQTTMSSDLILTALKGE